jgi:hypothetical protein
VFEEEAFLVGSHHSWMSVILKTTRTARLPLNEHL